MATNKPGFTRVLQARFSNISVFFSQKKMFLIIHKKIEYEQHTKIKIYTRSKYDNK